MVSACRQVSLIEIGKEGIFEKEHEVRPTSYTSAAIGIDLPRRYDISALHRLTLIVFSRNNLALQESPTDWLKMPSPRNSVLCWRESAES